MMSEDQAPQDTSGFITSEEGHEMATDAAIDRSHSVAERQMFGSFTAPSGLVSIGGMETTPEMAEAVLGHPPEYAGFDDRGNRIVVEREAPAADSADVADAVGPEHEVSASMELVHDQLVMDGYDPETIGKLHDIVAEDGGLSDALLEQLESQGTSRTMVTDAYGRIEAEQTKGAIDILGRSAFEHLAAASAHRPDLKSAIFRQGLEVAQGKRSKASWNSFYQEHFPNGAEGQ